MAKHGHFVWFVVAAAMICAAGSAAFGAVSTEYLGDAVTYLGNDFKGSWVGNVGVDGYHLLNWNGGENDKSYPSYLAEAQQGPGIALHLWQGASTTLGEQVVQNAAATQRSAST